MAGHKSDDGLSNLIKQVAGATAGSETTEATDDVLKQNRERATEQVRQPTAAASANRRRRDRDQTTAITIHVDRELHTDIKNLAAKIERPAEIMLRRALRRLVTDVMNGRATKYIN